MSPAQVIAANGAEDAQREQGSVVPMVWGAGLCKEPKDSPAPACPAHRGHRVPASFTLTQLGLPSTSGSALTGWTCLADPCHHGPERRRQGLHTRLCRPKIQCQPLPCTTERPGHRIRPLLAPVFAGLSIPCRAEQPRGSSLGLVAVWLRPPVVAAVLRPPAQPAPRRAARSWGCGTGTCTPHPPGRVKRAAGAVRAPCRRQPIMLY